MEKITRRIFLKASAIMAALFATGFMQKFSLKSMIETAEAELIQKKDKIMEIKFLNRSFFQRLFGSPATPKAETTDNWTYANGKLTIDLAKTPVLKKPGSALRFEGGDLPVRVLVVYGENKTYRAYKNRCTHIGHRRLDPVPGTNTVQCCSVNKSTYDSTGKKVYGPAPKPITPYPVEVESNRLIVKIS